MFAACRMHAASYTSLGTRDPIDWEILNASVPEDFDLLSGD